MPQFIPINIQILLMKLLYTIPGALIVLQVLVFFAIRKEKKREFPHPKRAAYTIATSYLCATITYIGITNDGITVLRFIVFLVISMFILDLVDKSFKKIDPNP